MCLAMGLFGESGDDMVESATDWSKFWRKVVREVMVVKTVTFYIIDRCLLLYLRGTQCDAMSNDGGMDCYLATLSFR